MEEKQLFLLVDDESQGIAVEWTRLSSETFDEIPPNRIYNKKAILLSSGDLATRTVVYLKKVDKFNKSIKKVLDEESIKIGVS